MKARIKKKVGEILCKIGIHNKKTFTHESEVNWILMQHEITQCSRCKKVF